MNQRTIGDGTTGTSWCVASARLCGTGVSWSLPLWSGKLPTIMGCHRRRCRRYHHDQHQYCCPQRQFMVLFSCSDMALHAFSLLGLLIDISSIHDNIELPPNYETISYSVSSSRSQQTRPCVPKATPYKGSPTVLWTSVQERDSYGTHVIIYIENILFENFVSRTFLLSSGHLGLAHYPLKQSIVRKGMLPTHSCLQ